MVALKGRAVEGFLADPPGSAAVILVYGPDTGLVSERAGHLVRRFLAGNEDPFALVTLEAEDVGADPARLADEAYTIGLFGGGRVIRVRAGGADLASALKPLLESPPEGTRIVLEAGDLRPSQSVRKLVESHRAGAALPCYPDGEADLARLVDTALKAENLTIASDARAVLVRGLGGDRLASRLEVEKLCLYCRGAGRVELEDVREILGDVSALRHEDVADAAAEADAARLTATYARALHAGGDPGAIAQAAARHFDLLLRTALAMEKGQSADSALGAMRPPLHFRRRDAARRHLAHWDAPALARACEILAEAVLDARRSSVLAAPVVERALLRLAQAGGRRN